MDTDQKFPVTPGTWTVGKSGTVVTDQVNSQAIKSGRQTADELHYYGGYLIAESLVCEADARLIAAAPDLLAALERARGCIKPHAPQCESHISGLPCSCGRDEVVAAMTAAIAKAKGGAA